MGSVPLLQEVHDVENKVIVGAQIQIGAGLAALALCIPLPFLLPFNGAIAGALIGEGITDIVTSLIDQGAHGFSQSDYIKGKVLSYSISLITAGIGAIASSTRILNKALKICRGLASKLRACTKFKRICNFAAKQLDKIANLI